MMRTNPSLINNLGRVKRLYIETHQEYLHLKNEIHKAHKLDNIMPIEEILVFAVDTVMSENDSNMWDLRHLCDYTYAIYEDLGEQLGNQYEGSVADKMLTDLEDAVSCAYWDILHMLQPRLRHYSQLIDMNEDGDPYWVGIDFTYPHVVLEQYIRQ